MDKNELVIFDGFDFNGKPSGRKCMLCIHQFEECQYQSPYGEGAFLICKNYPECLEVGCEID